MAPPSQAVGIHSRRASECTACARGAGTRRRGATTSPRAASRRISPRGARRRRAVSAPPCSLASTICLRWRLCRSMLPTRRECSPPAVSSHAADGIPCGLPHGKGHDGFASPARKYPPHGALCAREIGYSAIAAHWPAREGSWKISPGAPLGYSSDGRDILVAPGLTVMRYRICRRRISPASIPCRSRQIERHEMAEAIPGARQHSIDQYRRLPGIDSRRFRGDARRSPAGPFFRRAFR